jgi:capsular exopolysaccharide synthesis family protein
MERGGPISADDDAQPGRARVAADLLPDPRPSSTVEGVDEHLVSLLAPGTFAAEQFRALRHVVEQWRQAGTGSVLGVSSATVGDGKTTVAINLAGAMSEARDTRVILLEADFRRPSVARYLALEGEKRGGLAQAIADPGISLRQITRVCLPFNLAVVPAGSRVPAPYELFKSARFEAIVAEAGRSYDYVIVDTPPLLPATDCRVIGRVLDAVIMVVGANRTPRRLVEEALAAVEASRLLGIVFNGDEQANARYYGADEDQGVRDWRRRVGRTLGGLS